MSAMMESFKRMREENDEPMHYPINRARPRTMAEKMRAETDRGINSFMRHRRRCAMIMAGATPAELESAK